MASLAYEAFVLAAVLFVAGFVVVPILQTLPPGWRRGTLQICLLVVAGVYCVWCWVHGHTLPMKTWGIAIARRNGRTLDTAGAIKRFLWAIPSVGLFCAGFLWCLVDPERQFLHDRLAGTRLFDAQSLASLEPPDQSNTHHEEQQGRQ